MKVGIIGFGVMGKNHYRVISNMQHHEVIGVYDPRRKNQDSDFFAESLSELLLRNLDACVVAVPPSANLEIVKSLANRNVPLLIEKPLATSWSLACEIAGFYPRREAYVVVGYVERFNPVVQKAKQLLESNFLGRIFDISFLRVGYLGTRVPEVGVEIDLLCHDIDLMSFLTNGRPILNGQAFASSFSRDSITDNALFACKLEGGIQCNLKANWLSPFKKREITITGQKGVLQLNTIEQELIYYENGSTISTWDQLTSVRGFDQGSVTKFALDKEEPLKIQFNEFVRGASTGISTDCARPEDAINTLGIIERYFGDRSG